MTNRLIVPAAVLLIVFLPCGPSAGQERPQSGAPKELPLDLLFRTRTFKETAISPDGRQVAWVEAVQDKDADPSHSAVFVVDRTPPAPAPRRVTAGDGVRAHDEHGLAWSPDGKRLAFLSDRDKKEQLQLYVAPADGGPARRLTTLKGHLADPRWSPDGRHIAFLFTENAPRPTGPTHAATPEVGVVGEHVYEQRLHVLDLDTSQARPVTPADLYVYEYDWSPDGGWLAAVAAHGDGDNNWYVAELYTVPFRVSGMVRSILKPGMQIAVPRWSPDGKTLAFIGGLMSDEGLNGGDIFAVPAHGGEPRNLTPGLKASASWLAWLPGGNEILFAEHADGASGIATVNVAEGRVTTLWTGEESIAGEGGAFALSLSADRKTGAVIRQSFRQPPEVWAGPTGAWKQVTHANAALRPGWGPARNLHWTCDGRQVQGWLVYPVGYDAGKRYPMVVSIHGGPASSRRPGWPGTRFDFTILSGQGYFVFFPNPRGSFGRGQEFTRANVRDFGHGDLRDVLAGVDHVVKALPVDPDRLGVVGWSYGGFMTMWTVTQTNRFRAAVAGAGIANWQSYYGQNGIDQWLIPYFGASVYDDPAVYARSSPINFVKRVKTPTLVLVGERDLECPPAQSYEFWHALKALGVPTQFVIYPNEGHGIAKPEHRRDILKRSASWLDRYLQAHR